MIDLEIDEDIAFERYRALIEFFEGDAEPLLESVNRRIASRDTIYVRPAAISHDLYLLGDIDRHLEWFRIRVEELDLLSWIQDQQRCWATFDGYWEKLEAWADADPSEAGERHARLEAHRALLNEVTRNMVL